MRHTFSQVKWRLKPIMEWTINFHAQENATKIEVHLSTIARPLLLLLFMLFVCAVEAQEPRGRQNCYQAQGQAHVFCCSRGPRRPGQLPKCCNPPPPPAPRNPPRPPRNCYISDFPDYCCAMSPRDTPCCNIHLPPIPPASYLVPVTWNLGVTQLPLQICVQALRNCSSTSG